MSQKEVEIAQESVSRSKKGEGEREGAEKERKEEGVKEWQM